MGQSPEVTQKKRLAAGVSDVSGRWMIKPLCLVFAAMTPVWAEEMIVADAAAFAAAAKSIKAEDTLVLKDGIWVDAELNLQAEGTAERPITLRAQTGGKVVFTGKSSLSIGGAHIIVDGLWFQNPKGEEAIELRSEHNKPANDCRITNCAVTNDLPAPKAKTSARFVSIYGSRNRVDHCYLAGKTTAGTTLVVWICEGDDVKHQIDHNHFGPREPLGKNGGETIRVGDSKTSMVMAACVVEHNLFEQCNGEAECISNKSCGNLYRRNTFKAVSGTLTLRHGNACRVEDNVFLGEGAKGTGGIRLIGEDHLVKGNYLENLTGDDARSAICLMLGIPNSAANGYFQVKRAKVTENTLINCEHNFLFGMSGEKKANLPPIETVVSNNMIQTNKEEAFVSRCAMDGVTLDNNKVGKEPVKAAPPPAPEQAGPGWRK
jgi:poly(beta-D-mannuronate) lyase